MSEWLPIATAPTGGESIQVYTKGQTVMTAYCSQCNLGWRSIPGDKLLSPTHWMPLPAPPETANE